MSGYWTTDDAEPHHLYHDVLIAIDEQRKLNNGQPSLWAFLYDQLDLSPGSHIVHIGIGTGYYTAILANIVGREGHVTAVEIDTDLAARAATNLDAWPQVNVIAADGFTFRPDRPADVIIVNAGVTHIALPWLDALSETNGRLLVPLTGENRWGAFILITRVPGAPPRYAARNVCRVGVIDCVGGRDSEAAARLIEALRRTRDAPPVQSLRRAPDEPDGSCWLAGDGWWLSVAPVATCT
jgi:protein-L-isoaspartate(D-aspartate) O-methyltransferase